MCSKGACFSGAPQNGSNEGMSGRRMHKCCHEKLSAARESSLYWWNCLPQTIIHARKLETTWDGIGNWMA